MATIIVLRGIPGSGKSTFAASKFPRARKFSADDFFIDGNGVYNFDPSKLPQAHAQCLRRAIEAMQYAGAGDDIVIDNTNITAWECAPYVSTAKAFGHDAQIITLQVDPTTAAARCIHGVPTARIFQMAKAIGEERFPPFWQMREEWTV